MKKYSYLLLACILMVFCWTCKKDNNTPTPVVKTPLSCISTITTFKNDTTVQVWNVQDTSKGVAHAIKVCKKWTARVNASYLGGGVSLLFENFYAKNEDKRKCDSWIMRNIPLKKGCYPMVGTKSATQSTDLISGFNAQDDDVLENSYQLDVSTESNYLEITKIDTVSNYVEGRFMATFLRVKNKKKVWYLQDTISFYNGNFWAKIQK
jgi:hypothetical protein